MLERVSVCALAALALVAASPLAAQDDEAFAERERALARELAEQQEAAEQRDPEAARELAQQQEESAQRERELTREYEAQQREFESQQRELQAQQAQQQREMAREYEAQQREFASQARELAQQQEQSARELARELANARSELQVSAAEIARLSAELSGKAMGDAVRSVQNDQRVMIQGRGSMLGINIQDTDGGVRVNGVSPNGPAATAGVAVGDTIVAIDGVELDDGAGTAGFLSRMGDVEPGQDVELRIRRGSNGRVVVVRAAENTGRLFQYSPFFRALPAAPAAPAASAAPTAPFRIGPGEFVYAFGGPWNDVELLALTAGLGEYFGTEEGLLVARAGSMAELGLRDGDVILEVGGRQPQSPEHATRIFASFQPGESVPLSIMRQRRRETVTITVPNEPAAWRSGGPWIVRPERAERPERPERPERAEQPEAPERPEL
ncbi:MAG TPA: PDZ domain-containing protein [Gammaproteobacteria bacterium]|nr:PDZ domain-containing protein [Gammaproteobacteria bacterium]